MSKLLEHINSPDDLKKLNFSQLYELADELREFILNTVAVTGGHLASNLGVVELTIALHLMFDFSKDRLIWDVGHQSYVHKILTGRKKDFSTLRQIGGISGFPKTSESIYDSFNTGHSSTSISAALGMARARDLQGKSYKVVAVIGDGALTGGMAFEALNDAGSSNTDMIIILNDNEMSITHNVGGMSTHLRKLTSRPGYNKLKNKVRNRLLKLPGIGKPLLGFATRLKESVKHFVTEDVIFDSLGLKYIGKVDGHNIKELCAALKLANEIKGPVVVHVSTIKGKGYHPAESMPEKYHGIAPFDVETGGVLKTATLSNSEFFGNVLCDLAKDDPSIIAITAAMAEGTGLMNFSVRYPRRFFDVGIAEQHAVTMAAGLAANGMKPFVAIYSTFLQRAYDQLLHDVALQKLPVVFAVDRAGVVGEDGETHQGIFDLSYMLTMPNFTIMVPAYREEFERMIRYAAKNASGPISIRYPRINLENMGDATEVDDIFKGKILRHGTDITIIATGAMVPRALKAAEIMETRGISAEVLNIRVIKPLDISAIEESVLRTGCFLSLEDNTVIGCFGTYVLEELGKRGVYVPSMQLGLPDEPIPHGNRDVVLEHYCLDSESISKSAEELYSKKVYVNNEYR